MVRFVPNVPCGVESDFLWVLLQHPLTFLMYRVELKVLERLSQKVSDYMFLMYRVELKGIYQKKTGNL